MEILFFEVIIEILMGDEYGHIIYLPNFVEWLVQWWAMND
jgi:hypothetical protein